MSDVGINFPWWFGAGILLLYALPYTTALLAGLAIACFRLRRRPTGRFLKWLTLAVAPFWLAGAFFGAGILNATINRDTAEARRHSTLAQSTDIAGTRFPAGTRLTLDERGQLQSAELPNGATATLAGATWRGTLEFVPPYNAPGRVEGKLDAGTLAEDAVIQGVPCRAGNRVEFLWGGALMDCLLAQDSSLGAEMKDAAGAVATQLFQCRGGERVYLQPTSLPQLSVCRLAAEARVDDIACAAGEIIQVTNGALESCVLAKPARFGPLDLPAGSKITNYDGLPSSFALPHAGDAVDGFGLRLPPGTEAAFCYRAETLDRLDVPPTRYVAVAGVKLTHLVEFDCGTFRDGQLFEDAIIGGDRRRAGDLVTRADLFP